jgi:alpha-mannosidase
MGARRDRVTQPRRLVVVPHTHWDREWYRTREEFRHRLVRLVDGLLELLERDPEFRHFTLDGQAIVLDDYLEVRPGARPRIEALVRAGRLLVGPWYVLPDEWLVSGEALIRNLRVGHERCAGFGGAMPVGYVPDQFGHVGQLPQILSGMGLDCAVLWRGVGAEPGETLFDWESPDGTRVLCVHLIQGYGNAAQLPLEAAALATRLRACGDALASRSRIPSLLLMNGSDHLGPQPGLPAALAAAAASLDGARVEIGTLPGFVACARSEAQGELPVVRGELRSGLRSPLLVGCASSRMAQKRAEFHNDRLLVHSVEPLAAWLGELGGDPDPEILALAWRIALESHPHDSVCGCSVDAVHAEIDTRLARVAQLASAHLEQVTRDLATRLASNASEARSEPTASGAERAGAAQRGEAERSIHVWNPHAGGRTLAEGRLELDLGARGRRPPPLVARDSAGRRIPVHATLEERGSVLAAWELPAATVANLVRGFPPEFMGLLATGLRRAREGGRAVVEILLGQSCDGFDLVSAREALARELEALGETPVLYRARSLARLRLRLVDDFPGCGIRSYALVRGRCEAAATATGGVGEGGRVWIENPIWRIEAGVDGRLRFVHRRSGVEIEDALRLVSEADRGDEYSFDAVPGELAVQRPQAVRVRLAEDGPAQASLELELRYALPAGLDRSRARRVRRRMTCAARLRVGLAADLDRVDVDLEFDNRAHDHRLRLHARAGLRAERFEVESAFEVVERPIAPARDAFGSVAPAERPTGATPQRAFATLADGRNAFTVASRGSAEVEAVAEEDGATSVAVTVLRAVGWLSRADLAARPGHAGPPIETPGAQCPGRHRCALSIRRHADGDPWRIAEAHRYAAPPLLFAGSGPASGQPVADARLFEVDDPELVVSAIEPRPDGPPEIRLLNASAEPRRARVRWNGRGAALGRIDLRGRPLPGAALRIAADGSVLLELRPWEIAALRPLPAPS